MEVTRTLTTRCSRGGCPFFAWHGDHRCKRHILLGSGWVVRLGADNRETWWRYGKRYTLNGAWRKQQGVYW